MASFSRDSLQWNTAVKTFISIVVSGLVTISIVSYLNFSQSGFNVSLVIYFSLAIAILLLLAAGFSFQNYQALSRPLSSLESITDTFPLLSSKKYNEAREIFKSVENDNAVHSNYQEINQLQFATMQLTGLLEKLDANVNERSSLIHKKNDELQVERDFVKSLLDTAQLIILTVNDDLDITLFNDYGEKITGFKEFELLNTSVSRMFPAGSWIEAQDLFNELLLGNMQIAQMDTELIDKDGIIRQVSWL
ncbi:MAG: PAS domain S-box protein, partial [Proteobacteria bacterium]|nr:PAS domain S-box protein [Pseudomonadota bacterium]